MWQRALSGSGGGGGAADIPQITASRVPLSGQPNTVYLTLDTTTVNKIVISAYATPYYNPCYYDGSWHSMVANQEYTIDTSAVNSISFGVANGGNAYPTDLVITKLEIA